MIKMNHLIIVSFFLFLCFSLFFLSSCKKDSEIIHLTEEEQQWLKGNEGKIYIADAPDWPPLAFNEGTTGNYVFYGISNDYMNLLQKKLGFTFQRIYPATWEKMLELAENNKIQIIGAIQETKDRNYLNYTKPFIDIPNVIVTRKDIKEDQTLKDLKGKKVALGKGFAVTEYVKKNYPDIVVDEECKDDYKLLRKTVSGEVYAAISDMATVTYLIQTKKITNLRIAGETEYVMKLSIGSSKEMPLLNKILQKGLQLITPKESLSIRNKWIPPLWKAKNIPSYIICIIAFIILIASCVFIWNIILKVRVADGIQKYRDSQKKYLQIFNNVSVGIFQTTEQGVILTVNPAFVRIFGYDSQEEIKGKNVRELYANSEKREQLIELINRNGSVTDFETEATRKNGERIIVSINVNPYRKDNRIDYLEGTVTDITARKESEALQIRTRAAEKTNRALNLFIANMSHEIRTPMHNILGFVDLLERRLTGEEEKYWLSVINSNSRMLLQLLNDILNLARIRAGKIEVIAEPVNIRTTLEEIKRSFLIKLGQKKLDFNIIVDTSFPQTIEFDDSRLRQILLNLVGNAVKFTDSGGITLETKICSISDDNSIIDFIITVEDTGRGIDPQKIEEIFEPFAQENGAISYNYGGTGLGLSISRGLVELLKGEMHVESEPGKGSRFSITFKNVKIILKEMVAIENPLLFDIDAIAFEQKTILIVEDNSQSREFLRQYLETYAITLIEAENGKQGVESAKKHLPDLILMDMKMPVMSGFEAVKEIKADAELSSIPVIALTAHALKEEEEEIMALGCSGFLRKPVGRIPLMMELSKYLPHRIKETPGSIAPLNVSSGDEFLLDHGRIHSIPSDNIESLIENLDKNFLAKWQDIQKSIIIKDARDFAIKIKELGTDSGAQILMNWADRLLKDIQMVNINKIASVIAIFPKIIEQIKINVQFYKGEKNE